MSKRRRRICFSPRKLHESQTVKGEEEKIFRKIYRIHDQTLLFARGLLYIFWKIVKQLIYKAHKGPFIRKY